MAEQLDVIVGDPELITRVRGGDRAAFAELYRRHAGAAGNLARQLTRGPSDADDLVSESFARVLDGLSAGKGPDTNFRAYLFTTMRHTAYDRTRKDSKLSFTDDDTKIDAPVSDPDVVLKDAENQLVGRAYSALPERWQAVLWYLTVEGYTPAQTGELLGLTPNAVTSLAFRAREGLREAYLQAHLADTDATSCRTVVGQLGAWTRDGLSRRERTVVDAHLETCADCRALAAELQEVNSGLRGLLAPVLLGGAALGYLSTLGPATVLTKIGVLAAGGKVAAGVGASAGGAAAGGAAAGAAAGGAAGAGHGVGAWALLTKIPRSWALAGAGAVAAAAAAVAVVVAVANSGTQLPVADTPPAVASTASSPAETGPPDTASIGTIPANTAPANSAPANTAPANTAPANTAPANTAPANTAPANTAPANSAPGSLAPTAPTSSTAVKPPFVPPVRRSSPQTSSVPVVPPPATTTSAPATSTQTTSTRTTSTRTTSTRTTSTQPSSVPTSTGPSRSTASTPATTSTSSSPSQVSTPRNPPSTPPTSTSPTSAPTSTTTPTAPPPTLQEGNAPTIGGVTLADGIITVEVPITNPGAVDITDGTITVAGLDANLGAVSATVGPPASGLRGRGAFASIAATGAAGACDQDGLCHLGTVPPGPATVELAVRIADDANLAAISGYDGLTVAIGDGAGVAVPTLPNLVPTVTAVDLTAGNTTQVTVAFDPAIDDATPIDIALPVSSGALVLDGAAPCLRSNSVISCPAEPTGDHLAAGFSATALPNAAGTGSTVQAEIGDRNWHVQLTMPPVASRNSGQPIDMTGPFIGSVAGGPTTHCQSTMTCHYDAGPAESKLSVKASRALWAELTWIAPAGSDLSDSSRVLRLGASTSREVTGQPRDWAAGSPGVDLTVNTADVTEQLNTYLATAGGSDVAISMPFDQIRLQPSDITGWTLNVVWPSPELVQRITITSPSDQTAQTPGNIVLAPEGTTINQLGGLVLWSQIPNGLTDWLGSLCVIDACAPSPPTQPVISGGASVTLSKHHNVTVLGPVMVQREPESTAATG